MCGRLSPLAWLSLQSAATGESLPGEHWKELASNKSRTPSDGKVTGILERAGGKGWLGQPKFDNHMGRRQ